MAGETQGLTAAQARAADPTTSAWVTASAGTGKTHVLVSRFLRLMLAGARPDKILALTYTKAAAAEMATRVLTALGAWAAASDEDLHAALSMLLGAPADVGTAIRARRLFAHALEIPGGLKIQTIHAFCQSLLGRFPLEAGLPQSFQAMDERTAKESLADAIQKVLAKVREKGAGELAEALALIASRTTEDVFQEIVDALSGKRKTLTRLREIHGGVAGMIAAMRARLGLRQGESAASCLLDACQDRALDIKNLNRAANALAKGGKNDSEAAARMKPFLAADPTNRARVFGDYRKAFLTGEDTIRKKLATNATQEILPDAADIMEIEAKRLIAVEDRLKMHTVAEATAALYRLGDAIVAAYEAHKARAALLDFDDLIRKAADLLSERDVTRWVLYKLDGGIDHILIDEAQDTNPDQWRIVAALSEEFFAGEGARTGGRTVFAVGDTKQSIFSFQGADPHAFDDSLATFQRKVTSGGGRFDDIAMNLSFRSARAILSFVDQVFANAEAQKGLTFRDAYIAHDVSRTGHAGAIELWPPEAPMEAEDDSAWSPPIEQRDADDPKIRLAHRIARRIRDWIGREHLPSRGRPMRPGDILVLVRRRNELVEHLVNTLKSLGVPVAGTDRMKLKDEIAVMDLMALGQAALLPEDDYTLAVVLRSPLIGLSEEALFALAHGRGEKSLWRTLVESRSDPRFQAAHGFLAEALARADFVPPFEFFAHTLNAMGGRKRLLSRLGVEANDPIDEFLSLAQSYERIHPPSLQGFLHWVAAGDGEIKRDLEQGGDMVRVMTAHSAKGLQAPVVILPDTCQTPDRGARNSARLLSLEEEGESAPLFFWTVSTKNETGILADARAKLDAETEEEYRRLLYVALTRAEDRLYVGGWLGKKGGVKPGSWYDYIDEAIRAMPSVVEAAGPWGEPILRYEEPQTAPPEPDRAVQAFAPPPLPAWTLRAPPPEKSPPTPLSPSRPEGDEQPAASPLAGAESVALKRGRLAHALLQRLPDLASETRRDAAMRYLLSPVHALTQEEASVLADEVFAVLDHVDFAPIFGPGSRAEVPLAGVVGGRAISGQIDRLLVTESEVWIVDYKTNRPPPQTIETIPSAYLWQMALYRALLKRIYPGRAIRAALLWTLETRLVELPEDRLEAAFGAE